MHGCKWRNVTWTIHRYCIRLHLLNLRTSNISIFGIIWIDTVDGQKSETPPRMMIIPLFIGFLTIPGGCLGFCPSTVGLLASGSWMSPTTTSLKVGESLYFLAVDLYDLWCLNHVFCWFYHKNHGFLMFTFSFFFVSEVFFFVVVAMLWSYKGQKNTSTNLELFGFQRIQFEFSV